MNKLINKYNENKNDFKTYCITNNEYLKKGFFNKIDGIKENLGNDYYIWLIISDIKQNYRKELKELLYKISGLDNKSLFIYLSSYIITRTIYKIYKHDNTYKINDYNHNLEQKFLYYHKKYNTKKNSLIPNERRIFRVFKKIENVINMVTQLEILIGLYSRNEVTFELSESKNKITGNENVETELLRTLQNYLINNFNNAAAQSTFKIIERTEQLGETNLKNAIINTVSIPLEFSSLYGDSLNEFLDLKRIMDEAYLINSLVDIGNDTTEQTIQNYLVLIDQNNWDEMTLFQYIYRDDLIMFLPYNELYDFLSDLYIKIGCITDLQTNKFNDLMIEDYIIDYNSIKKDNDPYFITKIGSFYYSNAYTYFYMNFVDRIYSKITNDPQINRKKISSSYEKYIETKFKEAGFKTWNDFQFDYDINDKYQFDVIACDEKTICIIEVKTTNFSYEYINVNNYWKTTIKGTALDRQLKRFKDYIDNEGFTNHLSDLGICGKNIDIVYGVITNCFDGIFLDNDKITLNGLLLDDLLNKYKNNDEGGLLELYQAQRNQYLDNMKKYYKPVTKKLYNDNYEILYNGYY